MKKQMFVCNVFCICLLHITFTLLAVEGVSAKEAVFQDENYTTTLNYNDTAHPGDPVFVRMTISRKKAANTKGDTSARLSLDEELASDFYAVSPNSAKGSTSATLLAAIALSTWQKLGAYTLKITYSPFGSGKQTVDLPLSVIKKSFISETIPLDASNTAIRTDTSTKRIAQIEKLNNILFAKHKDAVYAQGAFKPPVPATTRRTSFFGDRRVYAYSNGKSETSVHWGTDYGVPTGTNVAACAAGKVVMAEDRVSTGWSVVIEHLPGLYSLYYHMDSLSVKEGDMVRQGAKLGVSGATGLATGPHLHWEIRLMGVAVDPDFFVNDFSFYES